MNATARLAATVTKETGIGGVETRVTSSARRALSMTQIAIDFTGKRPPEVQKRIEEGMQIILPDLLG
jgi:hypothetical protein